jgi:hypothetical protein
VNLAFTPGNVNLAFTPGNVNLAITTSSRDIVMTMLSVICEILSPHYNRWSRYSHEHASVICEILSPHYNWWSRYSHEHAVRYMWNPLSSTTAVSDDIVMKTLSIIWHSPSPPLQLVVTI